MKTKNGTMNAGKKMPRPKNSFRNYEKDGKESMECNGGNRIAYLWSVGLLKFPQEGNCETLPRGASKIILGF